MTLNKKLLAAGVAAAVSATAVAATFDLNGTKASTIGTEYLASEVTGTITTAGDTVKADVGFGVSQSATRYIRFDLTGATFNRAVVSTDITVTGGTALNASISQGGAVGGTSVIIQITPAAALASNAEFSLANVGLKGVKAGTDVTVQYRIFEPAADAVNGTNALASTTATIFGSRSGLSSKVTANSSPLKIDVSSGNKLFTGSDDEQTLGVISIGDATTAVDMNATGTRGTDITWATAAKAGSAISVKGDFSAAKAVWLQASTTAGDDCTTAATGQYLASINTAKDTATFTSTTAGAFGGTTDYEVCMQVDGKTQISKGSYTASFVPAANTSYSLSGSSFSDKALASLTKNGSEAALTLMLSPSGAFANWIRLLNPTSLSGDVFLKLYNDDGKTVTVPLANVKDAFGNSVSGTLMAGKATALISVDGIYAAAQAIDSTFEVGKVADKLSLEVEAEFSGGSSKRGTGIVINSVTVTNSSGRNFDTIN